MRLIVDLIGFKHGKAYGFEEYVFNLLKDFKCHRNSIRAEEIIIVGHESQKGYFMPILTEGIRFSPVRYNSVFTRRWQSERLIRKLGFLKDDVILYPGNNMPLSKIRAKSILVVHDLLFMYGNLCEKSLYFWLFRLQQYLFVPQGVRKANQIIAISNFTKNDIVNHISVPEEKIKTIYNYFCFDKYSDNEERTITEMSYPYVLSVCAGNKHKNHKVLLESFSLLASENKDILFVIVGSIHAGAQPYYMALPDEIKKRIVFMRHVSNKDMAYLYQNAKLYVSASLFEGLGMPVVEALYFGLPVVLSDIDVHREISFNKAVFFDPQSSEDLYMKMKGVLEGTIAPQYVDKKQILDRYSSENTSLNYIETINSLLESK